MTKGNSHHVGSNSSGGSDIKIGCCYRSSGLCNNINSHRNDSFLPRG